MGKNKKDKVIELKYRLNKKDIGVEALRRFYKNIIQIVIGPALIILGMLIYNRYETISLLSIIIGAFYMALPYIILLINMRNIKEIDRKFTVNNNALEMFDGTDKVNIKYDWIKSIEKDNSFIKIEPNHGYKEFSKDILIPLSSVTDGNIEEFIREINIKINTTEGTPKNNNSIEEYNPKGDKANTLLEYEVGRKDIFAFVKKEYYSIKRYLLYGVVFIMFGLFLINFNKIIGSIFLIIGVAYLVYPYIFSQFKIRRIEDYTIRLDLCLDNKIGILGKEVNILVPKSSIKVIGDNEKFIKLYIALGQGLVFYIPKYRVLRGSLKEFCDILPESAFIKK